MMDNQMQPGPELDAAVAAALGWGDFRRWGAVTPPYWQSPNGMMHHRLPEWSTDIAAAWQVVERLIADGFKVHLDVTELGYRCVFEKGTLEEYWEHEYRIVGYTGSTVPAAICLAALAALEAQCVSES